MRRRARVFPISCWQCAASLAQPLSRLCSPVPALLFCLLGHWLLVMLHVTRVGPAEVALWMLGVVAMGAWAGPRMHPMVGSMP